MDGQHCQKEFLIHEVTIGSFVIQNVKGALMTKLWGGNDESFRETEASRNGVIGFNLLSKFNVLLDYPNAKAILIKPENKPVDYDIEKWVSIPFNDHLLTKLKLNDKVVTLTWDTGAIPSSIYLTVIQSLDQSPCPKNNPYKGSEKCFRVVTKSLTTMMNESLHVSRYSRDLAKQHGQVVANFARTPAYPHYRIKWSVILKIVNSSLMKDTKIQIQYLYIWLSIINMAERLP